MRTSKQDKGFERHPELLTAALLGDWEWLERLLTKGEGEAPQFVIPMEDDDIMSSAAATTSADAGAEELITTSGDSLLHVVAYTGDGDQFLKTAMVIYRKASHLLDARNNKGDTPLHCAVRAGWVAMVSLLVDLAKSENADNDYKVKAMLRTLNMRGETALSVAVRLGRRHIINGLMAEDPQLARFPPAGGASPLYLAVELGHEDIARQLHEIDQELSYTGPDGRNALHAAVLKGQDAIKMLLEWNKDLIKEADRSTGSTPLHLAASWGRHEAMCLLLATDPSTAYQPDENGSFPIHVAAFAEEVNAVSVLLDCCPNCAKLRDAEGMTFLHVAVKEKRQSVVEYACKWQSQEFQSSVMNIQDDDGNTALHLAAKIGKLGIFNPLMKNRLVKLNITNNSGKTPLDLAWIDMGKKVHDELVNFFPYILQHPKTRIFRLLQYAGAQTGTYRRNLSDGHISDPELEEKLDHELDQKVTSSTQIVGVGSVLIGTVAFAAAFTLPGGYRADEKKYGGTPMLAGHSGFHVFIIANTLAFILSSLSIALLTYAGISEGGIDSGINTRMTFVIIATALMTSSARSLSIAFVFGLYVVLDPVAHTTAMASSAITALVLADVVWFLWKALTSELVLIKRLGPRAWWRLALAILMILLGQLWPYIVIAGFVKCIKIKGSSVIDLK